MLQRKGGSSLVGYLELLLSPVETVPTLTIEASHRAASPP